MNMSAALRFLLLISIFAISACSTVKSHVTRFHTLPAFGSGQTFSIYTPTGSTGIEFSSYSTQISARLMEYGWKPSASGAPDYLVSITYRMGGSHQENSSVPIMGQTGGGTTYHSGSVSSYGSTGYSSGTFSGTSYRPATFGIIGAIPVSHTMHDRFMTLNITDRSGKSIFEGRVNSSGTSSDIAAVMPEMIDSLFTGFPGTSGKTKMISKIKR